MKSTRALILVFLALLSAWVGQVAIGYIQVGRLEPVLNEETNYTEPPVPSGLAQTGARVFASEGCIECHSLSVRGPTGSADLTRGWGQRRSVPRDYLFREPALVGFSRIGPDLSNIGERIKDSAEIKSTFETYLNKNNCLISENALETKNSATFSSYKVSKNNTTISKLTTPKSAGYTKSLIAKKDETIYENR